MGAPRLGAGLECGDHLTQGSHVGDVDDHQAVGLIIGNHLSGPVQHGADQARGGAGVEMFQADQLAGERRVRRSRLR